MGEREVVRGRASRVGVAFAAAARQPAKKRTRARDKPGETLTRRARHCTAWDPSVAPAHRAPPFVAPFLCTHVAGGADGEPCVAAGDGASREAARPGRARRAREVVEHGVVACCVSGAQKYRVSEAEGGGGGERRKESAAGTFFRVCGRRAGASLLGRGAGGCCRVSSDGESSLTMYR